MLKVVGVLEVRLYHLSLPACTDMVYSKELERDVTTTAMAKAVLRLKLLASFLHRT